jgi:hypothetical protein
MKLLQALRNATEKLKNDFEDSKLFDHSGDKGEFREQIIEQFLRPFLPECYGLGSGQISASNGSSSKQVDVVIYDSIFSNVLFRTSKNSLFPCESVFGTIEVKSHLSSEELKIAIENIASVKSLPRQDTDMMDILPFRRINTGEGLNYDTAKRNYYLGIVFSYGGISIEKTVELLNQKLYSGEIENDHLPDFVFSHQKEFMILRMKRINNQLYPANIADEYEKFIGIKTGENTLSLFYLTVNTILNQIILRSPNFNDYWGNVFQQCLSEQKEYYF